MSLLNHSFVLPVSCSIGLIQSRNLNETVTKDVYVYDTGIKRKKEISNLGFSFISNFDEFHNSVNNRQRINLI
tara:strand:- start:11048 stop:11266 length:219 start_codon:yes stop_codon:yes gene_type:complete